MAKSKDKKKYPTQTSIVTSIEVGDEVQCNLHFETNFKGKKVWMKNPSGYSVGIVTEIDNNGNVTAFFPDKISHTLPRIYWTKREKR